MLTEQEIHTRLDKALEGFVGQIVTPELKAEAEKVIQRCLADMPPMNPLVVVDVTTDEDATQGRVAFRIDGRETLRPK